ncbi:MAG: 5-(carboxyamino)imidazole ribonucleotide synthase [Pseudomonadota bacterium]
MSKTDAPRAAADDAGLIVPPGGVIGVLGGGQLGRMLAGAAAELGLRTHIYCPDPDCPASHVSQRWTQAEYDDAAALADFARAVDVVTYEFENVPADTVRLLIEAGASVRPGALALSKAQDRLREKEFIQSLGVDTAPFHAVDSIDDLKEGLDCVGRPAILKTRRLGYDGKGQTRLTDDDIDLHASYEKAIAHAWREVGAAPSILEGFIPFEREVSVIGARGGDGAVRLYDPAENTHANGILKTSTAPATISDATHQAINDATVKILNALDYVGVIGVEFFVLGTGEILVNEFAPRVHNSGHWTQDACAVSQFEQQIRAVAGWPLGDPARHSDAVMENLLGEEAAAWRDLAAADGACIHLYGKGDARRGRKMGHVTRLRALTR